MKNTIKLIGYTIAFFMLMIIGNDLKAQMATSKLQTAQLSTLQAINNSLNKQVVILTTTLQSTGTVTNYASGQTIASSTLGYNSMPLDNGLYTLISINQKLQNTYYTGLTTVNPSLYTRTLTPVSDGNYSYPDSDQDNFLIYSNNDAVTPQLYRLGSNLVYKHYPNLAALNAPITFSVTDNKIYFRLTSSSNQTISSVSPSNKWAFVITLKKN